MLVPASEYKAGYPPTPPATRLSTLLLLTLPFNSPSSPPSRPLFFLLLLLPYSSSSVATSLGLLRNSLFFNQSVNTPPTCESNSLSSTRVSTVLLSQGFVNRFVLFPFLVVVFCFGCFLCVYQVVSDCYGWD